MMRGSEKWMLPRVYANSRIQRTGYLRPASKKTIRASRCAALHTVIESRRYPQQCGGESSSWLASISPVPMLASRPTPGLPDGGGCLYFFVFCFNTTIIPHYFPPNFPTCLIPSWLVEYKPDERCCYS